MELSSNGLVERFKHFVSCDAAGAMASSSSSGTRLYGVFMAVLAALGVTGEMIFSEVLLNMNWPYWRITACSCLDPLFTVALFSTIDGSKLPEQNKLMWIILKILCGRQRQSHARLGLVCSVAIPLPCIALQVNSVE